MGIINIYMTFQARRLDEITKGAKKKKKGKRGPGMELWAAARDVEELVNETKKGWWVN